MPDVYQIIITALLGTIGFFLVSKFSKLDKTLDILKHNIRAIAISLFKVEHIDFDPTYLRDYSPLKITPEGLKYLEKVGFARIFKDRSDRFFRAIDMDKPKVKYDVEYSAIKTVFALLDRDYFKPVKIYFYNNPSEDIKSFAKLAGVYVRDRYLEKHTEITQ